MMSDGFWASALIFKLVAQGVCWLDTSHDVFFLNEFNSQLLSQECVGGAGLWLMYGGITGRRCMNEQGLMKEGFA